MASRNIKGIIIEIGGNTTKLQDALKSVDKQVYSLNGDLKALNQALKLDPKNTELLAQKQDVLKRSIEATIAPQHILPIDSLNLSSSPLLFSTDKLTAIANTPVPSIKHIVPNIINSLIKNNYYFSTANIEIRRSFLHILLSVIWRRLFKHLKPILLTNLSEHLIDVPYLIVIIIVLAYIDSTIILIR